MISGESTIERVQHAISEGAKDFIAKPFKEGITGSKVK